MSDHDVPTGGQRGDLQPFNDKEKDQSGRPQSWDRETYSPFRQEVLDKIRRSYLGEKYSEGRPVPLGEAWLRKPSDGLSAGSAGKELWNPTLSDLFGDSYLDPLAEVPGVQEYVRRVFPSKSVDITDDSDKIKKMGAYLGLWNEDYPLGQSPWPNKHFGFALKVEHHRAVVYGWKELGEVIDEGVLFPQGIGKLDQSTESKEKDLGLAGNKEGQEIETGNVFRDNFLQNILLTNKFFFKGWTKMTRTGLGALTSGTLAKKTGMVPVGRALTETFRWIRTGETGIVTLGLPGMWGSALIHSFYNASRVILALEVGIAIGSLVSAVPVYDENRTITDWWGEFWWDLFGDDE
ncbi:MAG: hypothetical protein AB1896_14945 [Thermodesulfobacteriota bacterium]